MNRSEPPAESSPSWCLLSGGKDSVCTASVLAKEGRLKGCIFVETGIAAPDTRPFVERLCKEQDWPLYVVSAPRSYESLVRKFGFPHGPKGHQMFFNWLKDRAIREAAKWVREHGTPTIFATGVRQQESHRRRLSVKPGVHKWGGDRGFWSTAPVYNWSTNRVWRYLQQQGLSVSPAYLSLGMSGDCLCGAFARRDEAGAIFRAYPKLAERIRGLEVSVRKRFDYPFNRWGGGRSGGGFRGQQGQLTLESIICSGDCRE